MQVTATIHGELDVSPYKKIFQFNESVFTSSYNKIKKVLEHQQRININETLLLFSAFVILSVIEGKSQSIIKKEMSQILSVNQVMIGVPQMLQKIIFDVIVKNKTLTISINQPIHDGRCF